jgi:endonuclease G, mitochondrial
MAQRRRSGSRPRGPKTLFGLIVTILAAVVLVLFGDVLQDEPRKPGRTERPPQTDPADRKSPPAGQDRGSTRPKPTSRPKRPRPNVSRGVAYAGLPQGVPRGCKAVKALENTGFTVGYCEELKDPVWVVYRAGPEQFPDPADRPQRFATDNRTKARVAHADYARSGYDRGHMAPNFVIATRFGREAQIETFLLSNIVPQAPDLNQKVWRLLEERVAKEWAQKLGEVWVTVGPVFGAKVQRLPSGVAIPEATYMVILNENEDWPRALAYLMPQTVSGDEAADTFLTSVDEVEQRTGLDLYPELPDADEAELERARASHGW